MIEQDAKKLLTHAFDYKNSYQKLASCMLIVNDRIALNESIEKNIKIEKKDEYYIPIAEISDILKVSKTKNISKTSNIKENNNQYTNIWNEIKNLDKNYKYENEKCDICCIKKDYTIPYYKSKLLSCCRLNMLKSLVYNFNEEENKQYFGNKLLKKEEFDLKISTINLNKSKGINEKEFRKKCKIIWRNNFHKNNFEKEKSILCDEIENKIKQCFHLLKYELNTVENILKIIPNSRSSTKPSLDSNINPIPYFIFFKLSKLYSKYISLLIDIDYIIISLDQHFSSMLPAPLCTKFEQWTLILVDFICLIKKYTNSNIIKEKHYDQYYYNGYF